MNIFGEGPRFVVDGVWVWVRTDAIPILSGDRDVSPSN